MRYTKSSWSSSSSPSSLSSPFGDHRASTYTTGNIGTLKTKGPKVRHRSSPVFFLSLLQKLLWVLLGFFILLNVIVHTHHQKHHNNEYYGGYAKSSPFKTMSSQSLSSVGNVLSQAHRFKRHSQQQGLERNNDAKESAGAMMNLFKREHTPSLKKDSLYEDLTHNDEPQLRQLRHEYQLDDKAETIKSDPKNDNTRPTNQALVDVVLDNLQSREQKVIKTTRRRLLNDTAATNNVDQPSSVLTASFESPKRQEAKTKLTLQGSIPNPLVPWGNSSSLPFSQRPRLNFNGTTPQYLGVLLDAGRFYFPMDWIQQLMDVLYILNFNVIHFRLTDDQAFAVDLVSQPDLAFPTRLDGNTKVYSPDDLRFLVRYAKTKNITLIPEIDIPGHAASWAGAGGDTSLVMQCPKFICKTGYGIPLNVTHPRLKGILTDVIEEVLDIFDNPPFLHLGGDELEVSMECFEEVGTTLNYTLYTEFEYMLESILKSPRINYPLEQVIRWEVRSDEQKILPQAGSITHFWYGFETNMHYVRLRHDEQEQERQQRQRQRELLKANDNDNSTNSTSALSYMRRNYFISTGLYMDVNLDQNGHQVFLETRKLFDERYGSQQHLLGVIVGAFELDVDMWHDRNVLGRLLAVVLGTLSGVPNDFIKSGGHMKRVYLNYCLQAFGMEYNDLCLLYGAPVGRYQIYWSGRHMQVRRGWKENVCNRLTTLAAYLTHQPPRKAHVDSILRVSNDYYWKYAGANDKAISKFSSSLLQDSTGASLLTKDTTVINITDPTVKLSQYDITLKIFQHRLVEKTGILVDISLNSMALQANQINQMVAPFGFNLIQVRLADDFSFSLRLDNLTSLTYSASRLYNDPKIPTLKSLEKELVAPAKSLGIEVMPEISLTTDAGGWYEGGFTVPCPHYTCNSGFHIPQTLSNPNLLPVAYSVVRSLLGITTSPYFHLGSDERKQNMPCFQEAGIIEPEFDDFENNFSTLLRQDGISTEHFVRWENQERTRYSQRTGSITQCRPETCLEYSPSDYGGNNRSWFATVDLRVGGAFHIYTTTRTLVTRQHKPIAIVALFGYYHTNATEFLMMRKRFLAFAMGASAEVPLIEDQRSFERNYIPICTAFQIPESSCRKDAQSNNSLTDFDEKFSLKIRSHRTRVCLERSKTEFEPKFRDKIPTMNRTDTTLYESDD